MLKKLSKKEVSRVLDLIKEQWDIPNDFLDFLKKEFEWYINKEGKIFILHHSASNVLEELKRKGIYNNAGIYFCRIEKGNEIRLSIEGSQLLGYLAKRNVIDIGKDDFGRWIRGLELTFDKEIKGFVILRYRYYFVGSGKVKNKKILNYVPKHRRVSS